MNLLQESFSHPLETVPTVDEDEAADVLVEGKDGPHGDETPTHANAEHIAADDLHRPHHDDAYVHGEIDVTGAAEGIYAEEIECTSVFKQHLYPKDGCAGGDNPRVGGQQREYLLAEEGGQ